MSETKQSSNLIVIPFRDRAEHLATILPVLLERKLDVCVVEQKDNARPFNRGKLLNIGFLENPSYTHYTFHDVDMIPDEDVDYRCLDGVTHLAGRASQFGYKLPFPEYVGGVIMFSRDAYIRVSGHSNKFWGWGGEDNELYDQIRKAGIKIDRRAFTFKSLPHKRTVDSKLHKKNIYSWKVGRLHNDGLEHCTYTVVNKGGMNGVTFIEAIL